MSNKSKIIGLLGLVFWSANLGAQVQVLNPGIPNYEKIVYQEKFGNEQRLLVTTLTLIESGSNKYYQYESIGKESIGTYRIDPKNLQVFYSDVTANQANSTIRRITEYLKNNQKLKSDEILVNDYSALTILLRGFPWLKTNLVKLVIAGTESSSYSFEAKVLGKEKLTINGNNYECYKIELGLGGILGGMFGKTIIWFNTISPYYMVRYEGTSAGPGSPLRILEISDYQTQL